MEHTENSALNWRDILLLLCVARDMTNDQIASRIFRSVKLVEKDLVDCDLMANLAGDEHDDPEEGSS